jgi:hypothetical protein
MYGRGWAYYAAMHSRQQAQSQPSRNTLEKHDVAFDRADDVWIFVRLALVLAAFFAGLACILWIAN